MKAAAALKIIRDAARRGVGVGVDFTTHVLEESMFDDRVTIYDVLNLLENATEVVPQDDVGLKWKAYGPLLMGTTYAAVVLMIEKDRIRVITTHDPP